MADKENNESESEQGGAPMEQTKHAGHSTRTRSPEDTSKTQTPFFSGSQMNL